MRSKGGAGALVGVGVLVSLWSASGYIGAFMRACNAIYEVREGRPFWRRRPLQVAITLVLVALITVVAIAIVITGPIAHAIGSEVGLGNAGLTLFNIAKWPVIVLVLLTVIGVLYYVSPNVRQPSFRGSRRAVCSRSWCGPRHPRGSGSTPPSSAPTRRPTARSAG